MDIAALNLALQARAASDTGSGGLFNTTAPLITGWFPNRADPSIEFPYVVTNIANWSSENAFQKDLSRVIVRFSIFHEKEGSDDPDTLQTCSDIASRIYGNWSSASPGTAPTYGFHRHALVIASGNWSVCGQMEITGTMEQHEQRFWHFVIESRFWLTQ